MRLPWFMHMHAGRNSLTGILATPSGTFVRSCADDRMEATWYPMDSSFPDGGGRECKRIVTVEATDEGERMLEEAVLGFMHEHPQMALHVQFDPPAGAELEWAAVGGGSLATHQTESGLFMRIHHDGMVTLEFLPANGRGMRETVGRFADTCDEGR